MIRTALALTLAALATGPAVAQDAPDAETGRDHYVTWCASCHGMEARGDGTMAPILSVLPTDLTRLAEGASGEFPWMRVARQIDGRDPFLAHGGVMPLFGDFFAGDPAAPEAAIKLPDGQPMVTTRTIAELLVYLNAIQE